MNEDSAAARPSPWDRPEPAIEPDDPYGAAHPVTPGHEQIDVIMPAGDAVPREHYERLMQGMRDRLDEAQARTTRAQDGWREALAARDICRREMAALKEHVRRLEGDHRGELVRAPVERPLLTDDDVARLAEATINAAVGKLGPEFSAATSAAVTTIIQRVSEVVAAPREFSLDEEEEVARVANDVARLLTRGVRA